MSLLDKKNVHQIYEQIASHYDEHAVLQRQVNDELLSRLDIIALDVKNLLELGCGTGRNTKAFLARFPKANLNLLDQNQAMLSLAKKHKPWLKSINYWPHEANSVPIPDNSIDLVFSNLMLQNCSDPDEIFREIQRVTRENGLLTFSTLGPDSFKELRSASIKADIALNEFAFGHLTDMHDVGDALGRAGMREPVLDVDIYTLSFSSFEHLWQELKSTGNIFQTISKSEKNKIAKHYPRNNEDENYAVTFEVVYGQAWAGDGLSRARTPDEVHFPISKIGKRSI